jgi:hypothetical protein
MKELELAVAHKLLLAERGRPVKGAFTARLWPREVEWDDD